MHRILMVAYHFAPDNASGTHRSLHFARALHEHGHDVHVVTAPLQALRTTDPSLNDIFPYPDRIHRSDFRRTLGEIYLATRRRGAAGAGTSRPQGTPSPQEERVHDVEPKHSPLTLLRRTVAAWDALPDHQRGWYRSAVRVGRQLARTRKIDAVFASGPPWTGILVAARLSRGLGCPLVVDFRDPWTGNTGRQTPYDFEWCHWIAKRWEKSVLRRASLALFNSPAIMERAVKSYGEVGRRPVRAILNGSDAPRREHASGIPPHAEIRFSHFGNLYRGRSVMPLINGIESLVEKGVVKPREVAIELIGRRAEEVESLCASPPDGILIRATSTLPFHEAVSQMMEPSVLLVAQPPNLSVQIPTKLYDYLCTGNPVVVMASEDSATWRVASRFPRCRRVDYSDGRYNAAILADLVQSWKAGALEQERTVDDTAALTKARISEEFVEAIEELLDD
ncbi:MAG: glycosyltransferase [Gemmatimonadota bacterium]|nr:MAG: glycosyltransferase [Gemmatimonadota bacterium]